ncbi:UNVERIFIED_CONTAM: hypothetical protein K2H54_013485, partial [Gekko kuhli]
KCFLYCNGLMDHLYVCQNGNSCTAWYKTPTRFSGTLDAFVKIIRYEGIRSLWSGLPPTLVMAVPATVIYFTGYDQLRDFLRARMDSQGRYIPLVAGAVARLGAVTVISPLELIRTKMQSRQLTYRELRVCIQSSVAQDGWFSLWRGWGPTVLRDVPFSALYWYNYELVKAWLCSRFHLQEATFMVSFAAGGVSGMVAAVLTLPFDVVKTQRQIELGNMETLQVTASKSSTWLLMRRIRAESGTRGLFAALYWYNYELVKAWLCSRFHLQEATFMVSFAAGGVSGMVAAVLTLPFDVVKTQRQIELGNMETLQVTASKSSTWLLMRRIRAESGTRGLFAGFLPRVIKVAPACAIMISTYEFGKAFFQKVNQERQLSSL